MPQQRVAFIGLGDMGAPMATNVCRAGYDLTMVARRPEVTDRFAALGAHAVDSCRAAAEQADVVISMVRDDAQTEEVMFGDRGVLAGCQLGTTIIIMSTITIRMVRRLVDETERHGIGLIDAPVSGGHERAKPGTLTIIVGGDPARYQAHRPLLETMGNQLFYMGGAGSGMAAKLINNMLAGVSVLATRDALRLGARAGVDLDVLIEMISTASGSSYMLQHFRHIDAALHVGKRYRSGGNWALLKKDLHLAVEYATEQQVDLPIISAAQEVYDGLEFGPDKNPLVP